MRVLSVHIYKKPVSGPIASERPISTATAGPILRVHGGPDKAVHALSLRVL